MAGKNWSRGPSTSVTDIQRIHMAHELLETAKAMQLQGLKRILDDAIKNPLIPVAARAHAERAYAVACSLEQDMEWRTREKKTWLRLKGLTQSSDPDYAKNESGVTTLIPEYMTDELTNLHRRLDYEIAQVGMIAGELVYRDIIAQTAPKRSPGGVFRDGPEPEYPEEQQSED